MQAEKLTHIFREQAILSTLGPLSFRESDRGKEILSTITTENEEALTIRGKTALIRLGMEFALAPAIQKDEGHKFLT